MSISKQQAGPLIAQLEQMHRDLNEALALGIGGDPYSTKDQLGRILHAVQALGDAEPLLAELPDPSGLVAKDYAATAMLLAGQLAQWLRSQSGVDWATALAGGPVSRSAPR